MSIKLKVFLVLAALFAALLGINSVVLLRTVLPSFDNLERNKARKDIQRSVEAIKSEIYSLDTINHDWAAWNDTYNFVVNRSPAYIESNLISKTFTSDHINLLFIYDKDGNTVWGRSYDLAAGKFINIARFPEKGLDKGSSLLAHKNPASSITGLIGTELGPMLFSSRPITASNEAGAIRGTMIMGRLLNGALLASISRRTHMKLDIRRPVKEAEIRTSVADTSRNLRVAAADLHNLDITAPLVDIDGKVIASLHASLPRSIIIKGKTAVNYSLALMLISSVAVLIVVLLLLQIIIVTPLSIMTRHVVRLGVTGSLADQLPINRNDEIGSIARAFNRMHERLSLLAHYDSLTGLTNRQLFIDRAAQVLKLARRDKTHAAFLFLDLDNFKKVNDTFGHHVGDHLLMSVASRLESELRECDTISRMGGDEFTVVAYGVSDPDEFVVIGNKIISLFNKPFDADGNSIEITTSIGISIFPDHGGDVKTLLKNADVALYQAKKNGRNNFMIFTPS